ncbi:Cytochrome P450 [Ophiocordyceps sinensis CO18]|uniref:Cytochrome P450 n=1 Tax=Ophiocordyceps sinensis (strain Co18 / CGMCC 3.14243) TaxID=911162 RepID=T5A4Q9_OPHSC|nr:Cytochrome P450 [Ophiocordyceps sinensis CO18]
MLSVTVNAGLWAVVLLGLVSYVFLRPLQSARRVPNAHWSSGLSPLWILWTRYRNRELAVLEDKHRQLGPIVRLGPADLSISCYENGARTIYNGGFEKPEYYSFFSYYAHKNAFCSLTRQDHSLRRKRITAAYTKSAVFTSEPLSSLTQTVLLARLLPILEHQASSNEPTDVLALSYALSLDLLTGFQFGLSSASDFLQTPASLGPWIRHYEQRYCKAAFWPQELPTLTRCLKAVGVDMLPASQRRSTRFLEDWLLDMCERAERAAERGLTQDTPVVYRLVKRGVEADMPGASEDTRKREIASELFDQMSGGREVLGLVLAYTIFYISQNPSAQARLRAELAFAVVATDLGPFVDCTSNQWEAYSQLSNGENAALVRESVDLARRLELADVSVKELAVEIAVLPLLTLPLTSGGRSGG